jgi:hypothetical protein
MWGVSLDAAADVSTCKDNYDYLIVIINEVYRV